MNLLLALLRVLLRNHSDQTRGLRPILVRTDGNTCQRGDDEGWMASRPASRPKKHGSAPFDAKYWCSVLATGIGKLIRVHVVGLTTIAPKR